MKKVLISLFLILLIVGVNSSCTKRVEPIPIKEIKFETTPAPNDEILKKLAEMEKAIGTEPPKPIKIVHNGKTYLAFTPADFKKLTAKNELAAYLKETVKLMHERDKLYIMEINQLKRISELQNVELEYMQRLYIRARTDANQAEQDRWIDGVLYRLIIAGQVAAILLLL